MDTNNKVRKGQYYDFDEFEDLHRPSFLNRTNFIKVMAEKWGMHWSNLYLMIRKGKAKVFKHKNEVTLIEEKGTLNIKEIK